jgi:adenosylhomocysteine nucleosidase
VAASVSEATGAGGGVGIVCALREELGTLTAAVARRSELHGLELVALEREKLGLERAGPPLWACVCGVGKVHAARAATLLIEQGARGALLVVGTCGGLKQGLAPGTLVHAERAIQADLALRHAREQRADAHLLATWECVADGVRGAFLTADRPVLSAWRRWRVARHVDGPCVADMETAAVSAVAQAAGVRWAALRAVTDRADALAMLAFRQHFPVQAGRAADTIPHLLRRLESPAASAGPGVWPSAAPLP